MDFAQQPLSKSIYTICDDLEEDEEEEDFQTVTLDDDHWTTDDIPDRDLCIHEHSIPHSLCPHHAHTWNICLHHTRTRWILVTKTYLLWMIWMNSEMNYG